MLIEINSIDDLKKISEYSTEIIDFNFNYNPYIRYILYVKDKNIVGFLCYEYIFDRFEIDNIFVNVSNRGKGIGLILIKRLIDIGVENKIKNITLEVNKENYPAINLYKKVGFIEKAIRQNYYNGTDGILMERKMI